MIEKERLFADILLRFREVLDRLDCEESAPPPNRGSEDGSVQRSIAPVMHSDRLVVSGAAEAADAAL
jgi:hypothetical protein